jgi:membrane fusion protein, multidrug efflux system
MTVPATNISVPAEPIVAPKAAVHPRRVRLRRLLFGIGVLVVAVAAWEGVTSLVAFTDDAYVRSDLVAIAPQVEGVVVALHVVDNQTVRRGDLLATIDRVPFQLAVDEKRAAVSEALAQAAADRADIAAARDQLDAATAALQYAVTEQRRVAALVTDEIVSHQKYDQASEALQRAQAQQAGARAAIDKATQSLAEHEATAARAQAALGLAEWQLGQTEIRAPVDGTINNLTLRVGDTGRPSTPMIGIVDASAWRIIANYKQGYIAGMRPGETAWVWLDTHPWRFYRARIEGIARGISRTETPSSLLPYVAPTTDWIRLRHRFPVTMTLVDPPSDLTLYMGADATTVIFR